MNTIHIGASSKAGKALLPLVRRRAHAYMRALDLGGCELSISLVSDARIRKLNREWRHKDKATDVLSFPIQEQPAERRIFSVLADLTGGPRILGDIVISTDTARRQAKEYARTVQQEVERYLAHGLLHLLGYDHHRPKDRKKMAAAEARLIGRAGMLGG